MRKEIIRIFAAMAVVLLVVSALWADGKKPRFEVISTIPTQGARGVPTDQMLTVTFNQELDCSTLTYLSFTLTSDSERRDFEWLERAVKPGAVAGLVGCVGTTATFTPSSDLAANTTYTATITDKAKDVNGQRLDSFFGGFTWCFKTGSTLAAPMVTSVTPLNNAMGVPLDTKITATFDQAMNGATVIASFTLTASSGPSPVSGIATYDFINNILTFTPSGNLVASTTFTATISTEATNLSGITLLSPFVWTFKTGGSLDITPPTVISTIPLNGATDVLLNQEISATFSEVMDASTITSPATTFTLQEHVGLTLVSVAGGVTYAGTTATFAPTSNLASNTTYTATILTGVTDLAGNHLASNYVWTFKTGSALDTTPPTVVSTNPVNGATLVCINAPITATFSKPMDTETINTGTFTVAGPSPSITLVTGTVSLDLTGLIATFTPLSPLTAGTYTATITTGVTDLAGNALGSPETWSFTTTSLGCKTAVTLATAGLFGAFGGYAGITNQGIHTVINGDIATTAVSTKVTGFHDTAGNIYTQTPLNIGTVNGTIDTCPPPPGGTGTEGNATTCAIATQALADARTAYNALKGLATTGPDPSSSGNLGGKTITAGVYAAASGAFSITGSDLTLSGSATDVWVFQMASSLTVGAAGAPRSVILSGGALAKNVFWQVGSAATINGAGGGTMMGTIIAYAGVTFSTAGNATLTTLDGRALSLTGSVTMVNTVINVPAP